MKKIYFAFHFLRKFTPRKALNLFIVWLSYQLTILFKKPIHWGNVVSLSIEPTTACNLRCPECPSGLRQFSRETGTLKIDFFRKTIDEVYKDLSFLIFYFQGEPYLNPNFLEMVAYANKKNIFTITSTNAHFLSPEVARKTVLSGLDRLIISIDGTTQEVYEHYRKAGKLANVLEGTKNMVAARKSLGVSHPEIFFQFLVVKPNEHQMEEVKVLAKSLEVDGVLFKSAQVNDFENGNPLIPSLSRFSRYKEVGPGKFEIKNKLKNQCWKLWHGSVITWNGLVVPCCFDKDAKYVMGNLNEHSFKEIWSKNAFLTFRSQLVNNRKKIDICQNCTEGCSKDNALFSSGVFTFVNPSGSKAVTKDM
jgi:radical SAM protein with 4Fe4S-binding SPASM domain